MKKKSMDTIIDNRHLKVLAAKKEMLQDAIVAICVDEEKYGHLDVAQLRKVAEVLHNMAPESVFMPTVKNLNLQFWNKADFKNKDVLITVGHQSGETIDDNHVERMFRKALPEAKSITLVHKSADIVAKD